MPLISIFVYLFYAYLLVGLLFALWYVFFGVQKIDPGMEGARWNLRLLLVPGAIAFWIVLLPKYIKA